MNRLLNIITLVSLLILSGCFELEEIFTLNPDGSGKVHLTAVFQDVNLNLDGAADSDPREKLTATVTALLEQSQGIDAWQDVTYRIEPDGRIFFQATAYFSDINQVDLHNLGAVDVAWSKNKQGQIILRLGETSKNQNEKPEALTEAQIKEQITKAKIQYQQSINFMRPMLEGMKENMTFHLPARVESADESCQTKPDGTVSFAVNGSELLKELDALMQDDTRLAEMIRSGADPMKDAPIAPATVVLAPAERPLFNYQQELAAAQKDFHATQKKLGMIPTITTADAQGSGAVSLSNVRIGGVRLITEADSEAGIRPFNYDQGYALSIIADVTGPITKIREAFVTKAVTDTDADLLPENEWDRKIHFPTLTENKRHLIFDLQLALPDKKAKGIKEISGHLECLIADKTKTANLGFDTFAKDAAGKQYQAQITKLTQEKNWSDKLVHALEFKVKLSRYMIKSVAFQSPDGRAIEADSGSTMYGDNSTTFEYYRNQPFPPNTQIILDVYQDAKKQKIPFQLKNLTLLGQPRN